MNPLINMMAKQASDNNPFMNMLQRFTEFKKQWTPQTAQARVDEMLRNGQIDRMQYEQARMMAERFRGLLK